MANYIKTVSAISPNLVDGHYDGTVSLQQLTQKMLDKPVESIIVHARGVGDINNNAHFSLFLQMSDNKSVSVNPVVPEDAPQDNLAIVLTLKGCKYGFSTQMFVDVATVPIVDNQRPTIRQALALLLAGHRDAYRNQPETGSGCKFWCRTAIKDYERQGWVREGQGDRAVDKLVSSAKAKGYSFPDGGDPVGVFYQKECLVKGKRRG
ncbi:hypothetical protein BKA70DRAFT_1562594 [Coprinopsis sp. MPI-PUGE-AT-0042]|nr:hypothetical protein BKA70DRAFT_1562594 [Coprinopsis sp. MPI-PUGE-AT-0042]